MARVDIAILKAILSTDSIDLCWQRTFKQQTFTALQAGKCTTSHLTSSHSIICSNKTATDTNQCYDIVPGQEMGESSFLIAAGIMQETHPVCVHRVLPFTS